MRRNPWLPLMAAALFLVLAGAWQPATAQDEDGDETVPAGSISDPAPPTSEAEVHPPPSFLDELEELNPVDTDSVYDLTIRFAPAHPIFRKYLFRPVWSPPGMDHLAAGGGTRNTGFTTIRSRGFLPGATAVSDFQSMRRRSILAAERPHQPACAGATIAAMAARAGRHARA